jgi:NADH-quinone oxidoreductase subunit L
MKVAMALLAVGAFGLGVLQIPETSTVIHTFLEPTFADSRLYEALEPSDGVTFGGMLVGTLIALSGIAIAYRLWVRDPERPAVIRARLGKPYSFFVHKWYFDEAIDLLIVRPFALFGRFSRDVFERVVVNGIIVGGPAGAVRAGSAAVRAVQSGFLRYYAALLLMGITGLGLYFLLAAS